MDGVISAAVRALNGCCCSYKEPRRLSWLNGRVRRFLSTLLSHDVTHESRAPDDLFLEKKQKQ